MKKITKNPPEKTRSAIKDVVNREYTINHTRSDFLKG